MQWETVIQRKYMNKINIIYMLSFKSILLIFKDCLHYIFYHIQPLFSTPP